MRFTSVVPVVVSVTLVAIAVADEPKPPPVRDGLWEIHSKMQSGTSVHDTPLKMCMSKAVSDPFSQVGKEQARKDQCVSSVTKPAPNTIASETRCAKGNNAGELIKVVYTYDGDTAYHMEMHTTGKSSPTAMIVDGKYLGSCPAGVKPGDALTLNGKKIGS